MNSETLRVVLLTNHLGQGPAHLYIADDYNNAQRFTRLSPDEKSAVERGFKRFMEGCFTGATRDCPSRQLGNFSPAGIRKVCETNYQRLVRGQPFKFLSPPGQPPVHYLVRNTPWPGTPSALINLPHWGQVGQASAKQSCKEFETASSQEIFPANAEGTKALAALGVLLAIGGIACVAIAYRLFPPVKLIHLPATVLVSQRTPRAPFAAIAAAAGVLMAAGLGLASHD